MRIARLSSASSLALHREARRRRACVIRARELGAALARAQGIVIYSYLQSAIFTTRMSRTRAEAKTRRRIVRPHQDGALVYQSTHANEAFAKNLRTLNTRSVREIDVYLS
jgi:hypothetical protein